MKKIASIYMFSLFALTGCGVDCGAPHADQTSVPAKATCSLHATDGNSVRGMITFSKAGDATRIEADVFNLSPGAHGFHVHEWGDISIIDGKACGGHFNPHGSEHGARHGHERHAGDLGNLEADATGYAHLDVLDEHIQLGGSSSIIGRSVIIHANSDDFSSQPSGNAGPRVAQGVIGIAQH